MHKKSLIDLFVMPKNKKNIDKDRYYWYYNNKFVIT